MSILTATEPQFGTMVRQMNKLLEQMHKGYYNFVPGETWTPSVNLYETDAAYVVCVDLAGVEKDKIELLIVDGKLRLRGARPVPACECPAAAEGAEHEGQAKRIRVHLMEIDHGSFSREVEIPRDVHHERVSASYRDGMLWIELPKK